jgi:hypothetical protein
VASGFPVAVPGSGARVAGPGSRVRGRGSGLEISGGTGGVGVAGPRLRVRFPGRGSGVGVAGPGCLPPFTPIIDGVVMSMGHAPHGTRPVVVRTVAGYGRPNVKRGRVLAYLY